MHARFHFSAHLDKGYSHFFGYGFIKRHSCCLNKKDIWLSCDTILMKITFLIESWEQGQIVVSSADSGSRSSLDGSWLHLIYLRNDM